MVIKSSNRRLDIWKPSFSPILIDEGWSARVYKISKDYAARVLYDGTSLRPDNHTLPYHFHEAEIAKTCISYGISVPDPCGVFKVPIDKRLFPAYVMRFIDGEPVRTDQAIEQFNREIKRANEIFLVDDSLGNAIWSPTEQRVYLFDFERWRRKCQ
jgi:hypothetical protein